MKTYEIRVTQNLSGCYEQQMYEQQMLEQQQYEQEQQQEEVYEPPMENVFSAMQGGTDGG